MKQKLLDKILYVFDMTPYEITEDGDAADVIKVQQETYEGFIALNPDLADKIVKYNYNMFTVNQLEWAPYVDEPDPEPEPVFETLNITQAQDYELSASVQTDTDWTGKELYASAYDEDSNIIYLKLKADATDPTLLVLDTDYDGNLADETYLDENTTGSCTITESAESTTYTCGYSWTNEVVPEPETYNIILHSDNLNLNNRTVCGYENGELAWLPYEYDADHNEATIQYAAGLAFQIDERAAIIESFTPVDMTSSEDTLWGIGTSYIMPESDVEFWLSDINALLPESGAMYTFTGYTTEDASDASSTGTFTYEGEWQGYDISYVYGYADVTSVSSENTQSITVYIKKDDMFSLLDGNREPVYLLQSDRMVLFEYAELSEYSGGDTEYNVTLTGTGASDTYINVEVGGSLITDFTDYIDQETGNVVFTINAGEEIKIYPLDNQENYSVTCADADVYTDDSDQYYWYIAIPNDTTIEVDYTESAPE